MILFSLNELLYLKCEIWGKKSWSFSVGVYIFFFHICASGGKKYSLNFSTRLLTYVHYNFFHYPVFCFQQVQRSSLYKLLSETLYGENFCRLKVSLLSQKSAGDFTVAAVKGFIRSISLSDGNCLQDTLRLLTVWFEHGHQPGVYEALVDGLKTVQIDTWLQVSKHCTGAHVALQPFFHQIFFSNLIMCY